MVRYGFVIYVQKFMICLNNMYSYRLWMHSVCVTVSVCECASARMWDPSKSIDYMIKYIVNHKYSMLCCLIKYNTEYLQNRRVLILQIIERIFASINLVNCNIFVLFTTIYEIEMSECVI